MDNLNMATQETKLGEIAKEQKEMETFLNRLTHQNEHLGGISSRLGRLQDRLDGCTPVCGNDAGREDIGEGLLPRLNDALSENMKHINQIDDLVQRLERVA